MSHYESSFFKPVVTNLGIQSRMDFIMNEETEDSLDLF